MATSELKIILSALDKNTEKVVSTLNKRMDELDKTTKSTKDSYTKINQAVELAKKVFNGLKDIYNQTTQAAINQAQEQKNLARQMGTTTREAGLLAEMADDLEVSTDTLKVAFKSLNEKGLQPNFETIVKLAKEYQALPTSVAKNQFATDMFGKSGIEMQKVLDKNISSLREMYKANEDMGSILSDTGINTMDDYRLAVDGVSDSMKGLKIQAGLAFALLTTDLMNSMPKWIQTLMMAVKAENDLKLAAKDRWITEKQASDMITEMTWKGGMALKSSKYAEEWTQSMIQEKIKGYKKLAASYGIATDELGNQIKVTEKYNWVVSQTNLGIDEYLGAAAQAGNVTQTLITDFEKNTIAAENSKKAFDDVTTATNNLKAAQQNWNDTAGNDVANLLADYVGKGDRYQKALEAIDTTYGTGLTTQFNYQRDLKTLVEQYAHGGDIENFKTKLEELKAKYEPLDAAVIASKKVLEDYKTVYDSIQSKIVTLTTHHVDVYGPEPVFRPGKPKEQKMEQFGGSVLVGDHGPEMFVPSYTGHVVPNNQISYSIGDIHVHGSPGMDEGRLANKVITTLEKRIAVARRNHMGNTGM